MTNNSSAIAKLNDIFRTQMKGGRLCVTAGLVGRPDLDAIIAKVRQFEDFTEDNDPYGEHDFGSLEQGGDQIFWKIDYYDRDLRSCRPSCNHSCPYHYVEQ